MRLVWNSACYYKVHIVAQIGTQLFTPNHYGSEPLVLILDCLHPYTSVYLFNTLSEGTYMSARRHVVWKYSMAVSSHTLSRGAYIMAGMHVASRYITALGWHALSKGTYMSAGMNVASRYRYITALRLACFE